MEEYQMFFKSNRFKKIISVVLALALSVSAFALCFETFASGSVNSGKVQLILGPSGGGRIVFYRSDTSVTKNVNNRSVVPSVPIGTEVTLTADLFPGIDAIFLYWINNATNRVISYEKTLTFKVSTKAEIYAIFTQQIDNSHYVSYLNYGGSILTASDVALSETVEKPGDTYLPGFTFVNWDHTPDQIIADRGTHVIVRPHYTLNSTTYTVSFTNTENVSGAGEYNNFDTVTIKADKKNRAGETFSCWKDADGNVVSYDNNYIFRINYNAVFTAVYGETVTPEPVVRFTVKDENDSSGMITFFAERSVPAGFKLIKHGILIAEEPSVSLVVTGNGGSGSAAKMGSGISNEASGTYSLSKKNATSGKTYYAKAFVICENANGTQYTYYSATTTGSIS